MTNDTTITPELLLKMAEGYLKEFQLLWKRGRKKKEAKLQLEMAMRCSRLAKEMNKSE